MVAIVKPKRYRCRCSRAACQSRRTLPKHPDEYVRPPKCRACGKGHYRVDKFRDDGREHRGKTCRPDCTGCQGYSFPHRRGSKWCDHNPKLTPDQLRQRYEAGHWS